MQELVLSPHSKKILALNLPACRLSRADLCGVPVLSLCLCGLKFPPAAQKHADYSTFPIGVKFRVKGCLFLFCPMR